MKKPIPSALRTKIRMSLAKQNLRLSIGGGEKTRKPKPISLPKLPVKKGRGIDDRELSE